MRLMFTTALASAVMFAGPALAAGEKVEGTTGMTAPESSAAQLPGGTADAGMLRQDFESAGFSDWRPADGAEIFRMQSGGEPVWVLLMPENMQIGAADAGETGISGEADQMAEGPLDQQDSPDASQQAEAGDMPQRGEQADISETFEGSEVGEQADVAEAPELPPGPPATEVPQGGQELGSAEPSDRMGGEAETAEAPELPDSGGQDLAEGQDLPGAGEQPDIAAGPDAGEPGITGETQPEGFAAQIPGELRTDLEDAGFQQVESVEGTDVFRAKTEDGRLAFVIVGDLGGSEFGADQQQAPGLDQQQPGAAPGIPDITPGTAPEPSPGTPQQ